MAGNRRRRELRQRLNDTAVAFGEAMRSSDEEEIEEEGKEEEQSSAYDNKLLPPPLRLLRHQQGTPNEDVVHV
jgi:hypothetical protein